MAICALIRPLLICDAKGNAAMKIRIIITKTVWKVEDLLRWYLMFSIALLKRASVIYLGLSFSKFSHEEQIFTPALLELFLLLSPGKLYIYGLKRNIKLKCHNHPSSNHSVQSGRYIKGKLFLHFTQFEKCIHNFCLTPSVLLG